MCTCKSTQPTPSDVEALGTHPCRLCFLARESALLAAVAAGFVALWLSTSSRQPESSPAPSWPSRRNSHGASCTGPAKKPSGLIAHRGRRASSGRRRRGPQPVPLPTECDAILHGLVAHMCSLAGMSPWPVMSRLWSRHARELLNSHAACVRKGTGSWMMEGPIRVGQALSVGARAAKAGKLGRPGRTGRECRLAPPEGQPWPTYRN